MKKSDIILRNGLPAVNVKVYNFNRVDWKAVQIETDERYTREWYEDRLENDDSLSNSLFVMACEEGWEMIDTDARELFGSDVRVYSEGRSGGWAVVHGLPDVETWDAIMISKWAKFARWARLLADDVPFLMAVNAYFNVWEPEMEAAVDEVTLG